jgi:cyclic dehypoxanthinyl futalosine synthase
MTSQLRALGVAYLNARPLWESLKDDPRVALDLARPSELARALAEKEADVGLLPVAAAATIGELRLLRNMAIGARGKVRSVAIVSERPIHELDSIALDLSSRTSVVLGRLLLARRKLTPHLFGADPAQAIASVSGRTGALLIGDAALDVETRFEHRLDLAEDWFEWTGLPFVFAAWFARPDAVDADAEDIFRVAKQKGLSRVDSIAAEHAARSGLDVASLRAYLTESIRYDLGDEEMRGLERFWSEAANARLLPRTAARFDDRAGMPGSGGASKPALHPRHPSGPSLDGILSRAADGERLSAAEGERLLREGTFFELGLAADAVRRRKHPDGVVTYIVDRNVNYTNVCTTSCKFCAFYRPVGHPEGYVLSREVLGQKLQEVVDAGGVQILLQGGLNPELPIGWYEDLFRWMKANFPLAIHGLSPEEIRYIAEL